MHYQVIDLFTRKHVKRGSFEQCKTYLDVLCNSETNKGQRIWIRISAKEARQVQSSNHDLVIQTLIIEAI